jgi:hypothetical protein
MLVMEKAAHASQCHNNDNIGPTGKVEMLYLYIK